MSAEKTKTTNDSTSKGRGRIVKLGIAGAVVLALVLAFIFFDVPARVEQFLGWIDQFGVWAPVLLGAAYVIATVLFIPGSILTLGAGFLFGVGGGTVVVSISSTLGAAAAFIVARYLLRDTVKEWISGKPRFEAVDEAIAREGWKIVGLLRLSPLLPFNVSNYFYGITRVKFWPYVLASWIGMLPGTVMYVYFGSAAATVAALGEDGGGRTPAEWALFIVGLVVTVAVAIWITRVASKVLKQKVDAPVSTDKDGVTPDPV